MSLQSSFIPTVSNKKIKVCIAIPSKDMVHAHFAFCLQELVQYNTIKGIETFVKFNMGTLVANQRESLASEAIKDGATHILWLDSDMMFPKTICETLLSYSIPIIACNYSTRALPLKSVAYTSLNNWDSFLDKDIEGVVEVEGVGFGCVLTSTSIFENIFKPWFPITYDSASDCYLGEDMNFCIRARDAGYQIYVDCDASRGIFHVGSTAFGWIPKPD